MALDKLVDSTELDNDLTSIANAIRTKGGTSAELTFPEGFVTAIASIPSGGGGNLEKIVGEIVTPDDVGTFLDVTFQLPQEKKIVGATLALAGDVSELTTGTCVYSNIIVNDIYYVTENDCIRYPDYHVNYSVASQEFTGSSTSPSGAYAPKIFNNGNISFRKGTGKFLAGIKYNYEIILEAV